MVNGEVDSVT